MTPLQCVAPGEILIFQARANCLPEDKRRFSATKKFVAGSYLLNLIATHPRAFAIYLFIEIYISFWRKCCISSKVLFLLLFSAMKTCLSSRSNNNPYYHKIFIALSNWQSAMLEANIKVRSNDTGLGISPDLRALHEHTRKYGSFRSVPLRTKSATTVPINRPSPSSCPPSLSLSLSLSLASTSPIPCLPLLSQNDYIYASSQWPRLWTAATDTVMSH